MLKIVVHGNNDHCGVKVSRIGLGTWAIGGLEWGTVPDDVAIATCLSAIERGINLIDTAPIYGHGHAEEIVGKAIRAHGRREAFFIATKAGLEWNERGVFANSTAAAVAPGDSKTACAGWARTISTSTRCTGRTRASPIAEMAALLAEFQREGKVRALGVSNFSVAQMEEFRAVAPLASDQPPYNLFERADRRLRSPALVRGQRRGRAHL